MVPLASSWFPPHRNDDQSQNTVRTLAAQVKFVALHFPAALHAHGRRIVILRYDAD
jgi:hypothetical protein